MTTNRGNPLADLDTPRPPEELRGRALAAAVEALHREPTRDLWSRLWFSRPLRLAWIAIVLVALAGHAWLSVTPETVPRTGHAPVAESSTVREPELEEIVDLPHIDRELLADAGMMLGGDDTQNQNGGS